MTDPTVLRADIATAARSVAPLWPLRSFVAVNPLRGLEHRTFDGACARAQEWFDADTHLAIPRYRKLHGDGRICDADLRLAIRSSDPHLGSLEPIWVEGRRIDPVDVIRADLLEGPVAAPRGAVETNPLVEYAAAWCARFVVPGKLSMPERDRGFFKSWRALAGSDPSLTRLVGRGGRRWITSLPDEPLRALDAALEHLGVDDAVRTDYIRSLLTSMPGWSGYAKWEAEWAGIDAPTPRLRIVDLVAMMASVDAASAGQLIRAGHPSPADLLDERVAAATDRAGGDLLTDADRQWITSIIERVPDRARQSIWLTAHEIHYRDRLLASLDAPRPMEATPQPLAQMVNCIDVRSEPLRRHLESQGSYETFGFAGFFGVPIRWRPAGSELSRPRAPVLVSPSEEVTETSDTARGALRLGAETALQRAKGGFDGPFALAEGGGWILGPISAARTLVHRRRPTTEPSGGDLIVAAEHHGRSGLGFDRRVLLAEAILTTIGFERFAPIVLLCGHTSATVNNPHASSLDCGACAGAPGGANARAAANILNEPGVRTELSTRGIEIPDGTWFVPAEHDTASDQVTVLDRHLVPSSHHDLLARLEADLAIAGAATADERARRLPGDPRTIRDRGSDWAQVRPEWGLAGNAAFVIGPRSTTEGVDLEGRVFLHSYQAEHDPDAVVLENILTAPLIVAQWISAQYYFSTVDNEVFGAGDKMLHNAIGDIGVMKGATGDLAIGLPLQSVAIGDEPFHEPLRLLAVIEAPLERIDAIIDRNPDLAKLVEGQWINIAGRSSGDEPWSLRTAQGSWVSWHPAREIKENA